MPMRSITFLINSLGNGGAERVILALSKAFLAEGREVRIISLSKSRAYDLPQGVEVIYLSNIYDENSSSTQRMLMIPLYAWRLKQVIKKHQITLIQSHLFRSNYVNILSRLLGAKHQVDIVNHSVASRFVNGGFSGKFNLFLMKHLYPKADTIVTISHRMLYDLNQLFSLNNTKVVIHNPYDIKMLLSDKDEKIVEFDFDKDRYYLITVGRLIDLKQYDNLIEIMPRLPKEVELIMLGEDGGALPKLKREIETLGLEDRVHLLGQVANPFKFLQSADLFVLTSRTEGFPNVLIEAMLCHTAVVSSDCISGPREILAPKSDPLYQLQSGIEEAEFGLLYPVGDLEALQSAILKLYHNPLQQKQYEQKAYRHALSFAVEIVMKAYKRILEERR
jgi:N-acetylgalactosamine-N,N'-diacetylbacillosaminyl-diphospho-undecaprenol 4-alpha-N-acetylgalactosaminyltransferase